MRLTHVVLASVPLAGALLLAACSTPAATADTYIEQWEIIPLRTIGGAEEGPTSFTDIRGLVVDRQGRILVLEHSTQRIEMFDSLGNHLRTIGRKGAGPGEMNDANGLLQAPDGSLWVNDPANMRFTIFDSEGASTGTLAVNIQGYGYIWRGWYDRDSSLFDPITIRRDTTRLNRVQRFRNAGTVVDTIGLPCEGLVPRYTEAGSFVFKYTGGMMSMGIPFTIGPLREFDRLGHAWCGSTGEYLLQRVSYAGGDTLTLVGNRPSLAVTPDELEKAMNGVRKAIDKLPVTEPDWSRIPKTKPIIKRVFIDDKGGPWINVTVADSSETWDVYSESGKAVAVATTSLRFSEYQPLFVQGDRMYGVTTDENDVPVIMIAQVRPKRAA